MHAFWAFLGWGLFTVAAPFYLGAFASRPGYRLPSFAAGLILTATGSTIMWFTPPL